MLCTVLYVLLVRMERYFLHIYLHIYFIIILPLLLPPSFHRETTFEVWPVQLPLESKTIILAEKQFKSFPIQLKDRLDAHSILHRNFIFDKQQEPGKSAECFISEKLITFWFCLNCAINCTHVVCQFKPWFTWVTDGSS